MINESSVSPLGDGTPREEENQTVTPTSEIIHQEQDASKPRASTHQSTKREEGNALRDIGFKTVSWQELIGTKEPEIEFLIEDLLPSGCLIMLGGKPKKGKSLLALLLGISVALGSSLWGKKVKQGKVLFISTEDSQIRVRKRIWKMLGDPTQHCPDFESYHGEFILTKKETLEALRAKILQTKPDLIVLDPLINLFRGKELNSAEDMNEVLRPLQELAKETKVCILVIHHNRKSGGGDPVDILQGTITISGVADGLLVLRQPNEKSDRKRATLDIILKDAEDPKPLALKREKNLRWELDEEGYEEVVSRSLEDDIIEVLKKNSGGMTIAELGKVTGIGYKPLYKLLLKLEAENPKVKSHKVGEHHTLVFYWNEEGEGEKKGEPQEGGNGKRENGQSDLTDNESPFSETPSVENGNTENGENEDFNLMCYFDLICKSLN